LSIQVLQTLIDFIILSTLAMFLISGWKQGVVRSLVYFIGSTLAAGISFLASQPITELTYSSFVKPVVIREIEKSLSKNSKSENKNQTLPKLLERILSWRGITNEKANKIIKNSNPSESLESIIAPAAIGVLKIIISSLIFWILALFIKRIAGFADSFFKIPVLSHINSFLGAAFGFSKGVVIIWVVVLAIKFVSGYSNSPKVIFSQKLISSSFISGKFYKFNPIGIDFISSNTSKLASFFPGKLKIT
jgi:uncharacterized membrane protein required for colicin V production